MFMTFNQIMQQPQQTANFFHTFGFLTIRDVIDVPQVQKLVGGFDKLSAARHNGQSLTDVVKQKNTCDRATIEEFPEFAEFFLSDKMLRLVQLLMGKSWLYVGSDLSVFSHYIQSWHRDWALPLPTVKIGYYANMPYYLGGEFRYIPGSHRIGDAYANSIQQAMGWPGPVSRPGGLNERNYFPESFNYVAAPPTGNYAFIDKGSGDGSNKELRNFGFALPHALMKPEQLDIVAFNSCGVHTGTLGLPGHVRAMATAVFCANPFDESVDFARMGIKQTREDLAKDLLTHLTTEFLLQKAVGLYHPKGLEPPVGNQHKYKVVGHTDNSISATFGDCPTVVTAEYDIANSTKIMESRYAVPDYFCRYIERKMRL